MLYLGHSGADTTDIYERHEVTSYLKEDGAKLSNWIEDRLLDKSVAQTIKEFWGDRLIETDPITTTKKLF